MAEEAWNAARLIPVSGINGAQEQEKRATSALLAVMSAVREFGRALTQPFGAPAGAVQTFIEVPFQVGEKRVFPDGLIRVARGQREWTALVEVKTGINELEPVQLETYLDVAREQGYDALITISNQIPPVAGQHPTPVDKRKLRKVALHHLPWSQILTEAVLQKEHRGVADPDQAWILGELIRYLEHQRSGALAFDDMGPSWVTIREAVAASTLRPSDPGLAEVAGRFDALTRYICLRLGRQLGTEVTPSLARKYLNDPTLRAQSLITDLVDRGTLSATIPIPGAVNTVDVIADLRAGQITCRVAIDAPTTGRPTTRVNWLTRQLANAPDTLRLESQTAYARGHGRAELLRTVRANPTSLVDDPHKDIRQFRIARITPAGTKRGTGNGSFITSVLTAVEAFYQDVVQSLKPWTPAAPRLRSPSEIETPSDQPASLSSTALSSQDGTDPEPDDAPETITAVDSNLAG